MLNKRDMPLLAALAAIAFALLLNVGVSFAETSPPNANANSQIAESGNAEPSPERREAGATEVIARYTIKLTLFTGVLAFVGIATSALGLWQILLTRADLNATHRPQIIVHSVEFFHGVINDGEDSLIEAYVWYVNKGVGKAKITRIEARINRPGNKLFDLLPKITNIPVPPGALLGGQDGFIKVTSTESLNVERNRQFPVGESSPRLDVLCTGVIRYEDSGGRIRKVGFGRALNAISESWVKTEKSDQYEYSY